MVDWEVKTSVGWLLYNGASCDVLDITAGQITTGNVIK